MNLNILKNILKIYIEELSKVIFFSIFLKTDPTVKFKRFLIFDQFHNAYI